MLTPNVSARNVRYWVVVGWNTEIRVLALVYTIDPHVLHSNCHQTQSGFDPAELRPWIDLQCPSTEGAAASARATHFISIELEETNRERRK